MGDVNAVMPQSTNLKKAIYWMSETVIQHPNKERVDIIREAELRFDLTPKECVFLNSNFLDTVKKQ